MAFNNASGGPMPAPLAEIDPAEFDQGIATNIRGTFLGMKFQIGAMLDSGGGAIVNMASVAGLNGTANLAAYVAGKAGIIGLTKVAALDYADQGIRVNVVAPGPILTYHLEAAGPQARRLAGLSTPMRRTGSAEEVARTVLWLCSDESSFITGTVIPIDGGQMAGNKPPRCTARASRCRPAPGTRSGLTRHDAAAGRPPAIRCGHGRTWPCPPCRRRDRDGGERAGRAGGRDHQPPARPAAAGAGLTLVTCGWPGRLPRS